MGKENDMVGKRLVWLAALMALVFGFHGCAGQQLSQPPAFAPQPIAKGAWVQKADNLVFVLDGSSSMLEGYNGVEKFALARNVVANFNQTMPDMTLQTTVRTFGHDPVVSLRNTMLAFGPAAYSRTGIAEALKKVSQAGGPSPIGAALTEAANDLKAAQGKIAVVLVSDGKDMAAEALPAASILKSIYGDRLCIYTVLVGDNPAGRDLLAKIGSLTGCGKSLSADDVATGAGMAEFVKTVLIAGEKDSDGDGVYDSVDRCPDTPKGTKVDQYGCPLVVSKAPEVKVGETYIFKEVQFETNKADLKTSAFPTLDKVAEVLIARPDLKVQISGHTDSTGKREYNTQLSQRRAESVVKYLTAKGVAAERMTATGYGPDRPIASNDTADGRAENRRVEFKPIQ
jgi:OmpA-OmpF porin, OOP family